MAVAPFLSFALLNHFIGVNEGLIAAAAVALGLLLRDWFSADRKPTLLEIGTFVLFGGLAIYAEFGHPEWSVMAVRLLVDAGLTAIVLLTLLVGQPFTLQYAREQVPNEHWEDLSFIRANFAITSVWALAFVVMLIGDLMLVYLPQYPATIGILINVIAIVGALKFTSWYPERVRTQQAK